MRIGAKFYAFYTYPKYAAQFSFGITRMKFI